MEIRTELSNSLITAIIENNVSKVNELLNRGADPNYISDKAKVTPMHYAAQHNALEVIPLLVEAGAYIDSKTEPEGLTPLEIAMMHGHDRVVQLLVAYYSDDCGRTH
jgi:ankyrin repeat protein